MSTVLLVMGPRNHLGNSKDPRTMSNNLMGVTFTFKNMNMRTLENLNFRSAQPLSHVFICQDDNSAIPPVRSAILSAPPLPKILTYN